ncbi:MAG: hypothetical protein HKN26_11480 [Acidimicrobiales bacterium]|nr:hypothetical protein [Acidimicrobiales bacterium]
MTDPTADTPPPDRVTVLTNLSLMLSILWMGGLLSIPGLILGAIAGQEAKAAGRSMVLPAVAIAVAVAGLIGAVFFWKWVL